MAAKVKQATYNGVALDNGSDRFVTGAFGDETGFDGKRVVVIEFFVVGDTQEELQAAKAQAKADFEKLNARFTCTLDDTAGNYYADMWPNDGKHTDTVCVVNSNPSKPQTGNRLNLLLTCVAGVALQSAGGGAGASLPEFEGLVGQLTYGKNVNSGGIPSYRVLATFTTTFDDEAEGPYTFDSVEDDGDGKAVFVLSTTPVAFAAGMRLKVTAGTGYPGIHIITAIDVDTKKVSTDAIFDATETGTAYIGTATTGEENYLAAREDLLTDYLHCDTDGSRDDGTPADPMADPPTEEIPSTGMVLSSEITEKKDVNGNQFQVFLRSTFQPHEFGSTDLTRGESFTLKRSEPERWNKAGGPKPVYLLLTASIPISREGLQGRTIYDIWTGGLREDVEAAVLLESGETEIKPLSIEINLDPENSIITVGGRYQARNMVNVAYSMVTTRKPEDDRISSKDAAGYDYDQRPNGLPPKTIVVTATRVGIGSSEPFIPTPASDAPGSVYVAAPEEGVVSIEDFDGQFGDNMFAVSKSICFLRRRYREGSGGESADDIGGIFDSDLAEAQGASEFSDPFSRGSNF